jgi:DNA-binding MarR family transcriptional regulator
MILTVSFDTPSPADARFVKRFEARGHMRRRPDASDRRSYLLDLTPAGRRAHRRAAALFGPVLEQVNHALGRREEDVRLGLSDLAEVLEALRLCG